MPLNSCYTDLWHDSIGIIGKVLIYNYSIHTNTIEHVHPSSSSRLLEVLTLEEAKICPKKLYITTYTHTIYLTCHNSFVNSYQLSLYTQ